MSTEVGRSASDRSYLSIREVLDLLVDEFPDVTISKIRFLESRGLIHPERTPSGYRKFYEHDVERLRWILRQQREHFLPLKVIKGRLENSPAPSLFDTDALAAEAAPAKPAAGPAEKVAEKAAERSAEPPPGPPPETEPASPIGGHRLTADELASAAGAEVELVDELEEYGLVSGRLVAGVRVYDEADLTVVRAAAGLRQFGIEARHLRMFKHAAEREASLYAQVVTPLLRQRNPAARERAARELAELTALGAGLQAVFLRAFLREVTGGG